jgi:hypothetical protein
MEWVSLVLLVIQTVASVLPLRRPRIAEQSSKGRVMATKFTVPHPNGVGTTQVEVEQNLEEVVDEVNEALRIGEKFVTFTSESKNRAFIAAGIDNIREV